MDNTFGKEHRLSLKRDIEGVFASKKKIHVFPLLSHIVNTEANAPGFAVILSVPKKKIKKAHDRNRIRRLIRESLRRNKSLIEASAEAKKIHIQFSIVYLWNEIPDQAFIETKVKKLIETLCQAE
jgi:ribonuclease P protein component